MISYDIIEHGKPLQRALRETPTPQGSEVLVRILRSGVCHSDLHIWDGYFDWGDGRKFYVKDRGCVPPWTLGHEPYGVVEAVGPQGDASLIGQRRLVYPWIGCGHCAQCAAGRDNFCVTGPRYLGINRAGAFSTHTLIPDGRYLVECGDLDPSFAATLACSALTVYSAAAKITQASPDDWIMTLGCGGLGLTALSVLKARGYRNLVACDIDDAKLEVARTYGATATVNTSAADAGAQIKAITGGNLAAALDLVGAPSTASLALDALRKGGQYVVCGLFGGELRYPLPPLAQRALSINGSFVGTLGELKEVVALARDGKIGPPPLDNRPSSSAPQAMTELKAGKVIGRVVLNFETEPSV